MYPSSLISISSLRRAHVVFALRLLAVLTTLQPFGDCPMHDIHYVVEGPCSFFFKKVRDGDERASSSSFFFTYMCVQIAVPGYTVLSLPIPRGLLGVKAYWQGFRDETLSCAYDTLVYDSG